MLEVHRVVSVQVRADWNTIRVARPQGERGVVGVEAERVSVLPETVDVGVDRDFGLDAEILRFEDDGMRSRGKQNFPGGRTLNREAKW